MFIAYIVIFLSLCISPFANGFVTDVLSQPKFPFPGSPFELEVNPCNDMLVYWVIDKPEDRVTHNSQPFLPSGVHSCFDGSKLYLTLLNGDKPIQIGPINANCWHPVWAPNGEKIAFYSDAGGSAHFWIYELASQQAHQVSDVIVNPNHPSAYRPRWRSDCRHLFVPLRELHEMQGNTSGPMTCPL